MRDDIARDGMSWGVLHGSLVTIVIDVQKMFLIQTLVRLWFFGEICCCTRMLKLLLDAWY